jgi:hypothetical protein
MTKEDKTQEPEEKGQEEEKGLEKQQSPDEQSELFSEGFKDATEDKESDGEDKDKGTEKESEGKGKKGDKDKSDEKENESDEDGNKGKESAKEKSDKEGEGEEKGEAEKEIEARAKRLKQIMSKSTEEEEEEQKPKKRASKKKQTKAKEEEEEEEEEEESKSLLKDVKLTEAEKDFLEDMPEVKSILEKAVKKAMKSTSSSGDSEEFSDAVAEVLERQDREIAVLRTQVVLTKLVPEWESIVFDGNKVGEDGKRVGNKEFWGWLEKQPDLYRALANSDNPSDNAAVIKYYKENQAKDKLAEKDKESKGKLDKVKDLHSHSANAGKTAKKAKKSVDENDFGGHFGVAAGKAAKGQL